MFRQDNAILLTDAGTRGLSTHDVPGSLV